MPTSMSWTSAPWVTPPDVNDQIPAKVMRVAPTWPATNTASQRPVPSQRSAGASTSANGSSHVNRFPLWIQNALLISTDTGWWTMLARLVLCWRSSTAPTRPLDVWRVSVVTARMARYVTVPGAECR